VDKSATGSVNFFLAGDLRLVRSVRPGSPWVSWCHGGRATQVGGLVVSDRLTREPGHDSGLTPTKEALSCDPAH